MEDLLPVKFNKGLRMDGSFYFITINFDRAEGMVHFIAMDAMTHVTLKMVVQASKCASLLPGIRFVLQI